VLALDGSVASRSAVGGIVGATGIAPTGFASTRDGGLLGLESGVGTAFRGPYSLARFAPDGRPRPDFGAGGRIAIGTAEQRLIATQVVDLPDGRIAVAGFALDESNFFRPREVFFARFASDGRADASFGSNGLVRLQRFDANYALWALRLVVQGDGSMIAFDVEHDIGRDFRMCRYAVSAGGAPMELDGRSVVALACRGSSRAG
jgi:hypothetical protein